MIFQTKLNDQLPKLAWIARTNRSNETIFVEHGEYVECSENWMVEGVWDGDFNKGEFHKSENFFGSGIRIDGNLVYFVPSSAIVDRLIYCEYKQDIIVSNSLILLMAYTGATLDRDHDYVRESVSILKGINKYDKEFKILHPKVKDFKQLFSEILVISKNEINFENPKTVKRIYSYEQYYNSLKKVLYLIGDNYKDNSRKIKIDAFTTISSGYDSVAVSSLVKDIGVNTSFTGKKPIHLNFNMVRRLFRTNDRFDDGTLAAKALGLNVNYLDTEKSNISEDELYFLSTNYPKYFSIRGEHSQLDGHHIPVIKDWAELSHHSLANFIEKNCSVAVVFTGYHGGKIWGKNLDIKYLVNDIIRGDTSGLNLTEIRLKCGFINIAVPFILAINIRDINKISNSIEMRSWSLKRQEYDRPIPRRIAEDSGVHRNYFGIRKKYIAQNYFYPVNRKMRKEFFIFLKEKYRIRQGFVFIYLGLNYIAKFYHFLFVKKILKKTRNYSFKFWKKYDFYFLMNHWAIRVLSKRYRKRLNDKLSDL